MPIIVCFSYGLDKDGSFGKVNEARCEKAAQLYKNLKERYPWQIWIIVTAGTIPNFPKQQRPLRMMQREALGALGVPLSHVLPDDIDFYSRWRERNVLSTAEEIDAAIAIADEKEIIGPFFAVSHWYQLPRIIWLGLWRKILFWPAPVLRATPWTHVALEIPKLVFALCWPFENKRLVLWARERQIW